MPDRERRREESEMKDSKSGSGMAEKAPGRRAFLRLTGAGLAAAGGIASTAGSGGPQRAEAAETRQQAGYRETDHVRKFYETARF